MPKTMPVHELGTSHPALVFIEGNFERRAGNQGTAWGGLVDGFYRGKQFERCSSVTIGTCLR